MEKQEQGRLIIALVLCFVVIMAWQFFFAPSADEQAQQAQKAAEAEQKTAALSEQAPQQAAPADVQAQAEEFIPTTGKAVNVTTPLYTATFNTQGGILENFTLHNYKQTLAADSPDVDLVGKLAAPKGPLGIILGKGEAEIHTWIKGQWAFEGQESTIIEGADTTTLVFSGMVSGFRIERTLTFHADSYLIQESTVVTNLAATGVEGTLSYTSAMEMPGPDNEQYNRYNLPRVISLNNADGFDEMEDRDDLAEKGYSVIGDLKWGALNSGYFMTAIMPENADSSLYSTATMGELDDVFRMAVVSKETFQPNTAKTVKVAYYMGPVLKDQLTGMPNDLSDAVNFGFFDVLAKPLLMALNFMYGYVGNYGIAIILLTICIKIAFWPLSQKSYQSMEQMKKLQPMVQKLREKYGDDKQRLNQETMALYKTYKVNPMGGCLPMALQIPVFFGLYKALLGAVELRHAPFITHLPFTDLPWLADLSAMDPYYITPIIMGVTMLLQQLMTPAAGGDPTQKKIMMLMPVVFTWMFLYFPSGLVVYWMVNNVLSIVQQMMIARKAKQAAA